MVRTTQFTNHLGHLEGVPTRSLGHLPPMVIHHFLLAVFLLITNFRRVLKIFKTLRRCVREKNTKQLDRFASGGFEGFIMGCFKSVIKKFGGPFPNKGLNSE